MTDAPVSNAPASNAPVIDSAGRTAAEVYLRGTGLGIGGQACFVGAWIIGLLGALTQSSLGITAIAALVAGIVLSAIALVLVRPRFGVLGPVAAWILIGGVVAGLAAYAAIPGEREWGKLGAMLFGMAVVAAGICIGHIVAALGLLRSGPAGIGIAAAVMQAVALVVALLSAFAQAELWVVAGGASFAGHALMLAGFIAMRRPPRTA